MAAHFTVPTVSQQKQTFMKDKWHVRYNEAFTKDLYNQLMAWCKPQIGVGGLQWRNFHKGEPYSKFKTKDWSYFIFGGYTSMVGVDNNSQGNPEISIADLLQIIGWKTPSSELTSLPEKWCIKFSSDEINRAINKHFAQHLYWANNGCYTAYYWRSDNRYTSDVNGYTEITFDQFKKWVLGDNKDSLLTEAKKRFPVGTVFYPVSASTQTVTKFGGTGTVGSELDIKWLGEEIINGNNGYLYSKGAWAEIVSCNTVAPTPDKEHKTENLLEEAKRRYPVGTKVKGIHLGHEVVIGTNSFEVSSSDFCIRHRGSNGAFDALYDSNLRGGGPTWAEIISKPNEVPEYVECINIDGGDDGIKIGVIYKVSRSEPTWAGEPKPVVYLCDKTSIPYYLSYFKPSTREAYDAQFKKQEDFGTISSGLLSPDVGPIWNKGLRDYPSCYSGAGVAMLGGIGGALSGGKPFWQYLPDFWQDLPDFEVRTEELNPMEVYKRYGVYIHKSPPEMKPSTKVSVNTHEEFKITINKPKTIKI